jgi:hypothetical protein
MKKNISSSDYNIPFETMKDLHKKGNLQLGIDSSFSQQLLNNKNALQLAQDEEALQRVSSAFNIWFYISIAIVLFSVYASLTQAWWSFVLGVISYFFINKINRKSMDENYLEVCLNDKKFYENMNTAKKFNFQVDEGLVATLPIRDSQIITKY